MEKPSCTKLHWSQMWGDEQRMTKGEQKDILRTSRASRAEAAAVSCLFELS